MALSISDPSRDIQQFLIQRLSGFWGEDVKLQKLTFPVGRNPEAPIRNSIKLFLCLKRLLISSSSGDG